MSCIFYEIIVKLYLEGVLKRWKSIVTSLKLTGSDPDNKKNTFSHKSASHFVWSHAYLLSNRMTGPEGRNAWCQLAQIIPFNGIKKS